MNITERFLKYVSFDTGSDENSPSVPSTEKQKVLGAFLADELKRIGLEDVRADGYGYVYGLLPATEDRKDETAVGLIAHMDTSPAVSGSNIRPRIIKYEGGDIYLGNGETLTVADYPFIRKYIGQELIVTDGSTLLGADDKAGIAEIVTACEYLAEHPEIPHRAIRVGFTPDEEIGRGADKFDLENFKVGWAYTVDGGELGELEYENFNAAGAKITVKGVNIHPGTAKNVMKNATLIGAEFISRLPAAETPAHTENYEGFYHVCGIEGDESLCSVELIIRDHDRGKFEKRKKFVSDLCEYMNGVYGEGTLTAQIKDSYYNMKEYILPHMHIIRRAKAAMRENGVEPTVIPVRGGTDGARLSEMGLPCPNLATGGANYHGVREFIPVPSMEKTVGILISLAKQRDADFLNDEPEKETD